MTTIIRFPLERSVGYQLAQLKRALEVLRCDTRLDRAITRLDEMAVLARRSKADCRTFRRDRIERRE